MRLLGYASLTKCSRSQGLKHSSSWQGSSVRFAVPGALTWAQWAAACISLSLRLHLALGVQICRDAS